MYMGENGLATLTRSSQFWNTPNITTHMKRCIASDTHGLTHAYLSLSCTNSATWDFETKNLEYRTWVLIRIKILRYNLKYIKV